MVVVASVNLGSSSLKYAAYRFDGGEPTVLTAGTATDQQEAFDDLARVGPPDAVGHRIVHGGPHFDGPVRIGDAVLAELRRLVPFAPLHLPPEIDTVEDAAARFPDATQVACFDTAFHRRLPELAERLPLPRRLYDDGVRRYGFHGLSYEYVSEAIDAARLGRVVIAHLGSGASMVALRDGAPVHTTMGLTPTGGLVMSNRTGDLDPGVVLYLLRHGSGDADATERLLYGGSGLLALSGTTGDMQVLLSTRMTDRAAAFAVDAFVRSAVMHVGALAAVLGGLDVLVFTGGIGEHAAPVREEIATALAHLGVGTTVPVRVVATDEEVVIARHTYRLATSRFHDT